MAKRKSREPDHVQAPESIMECVLPKQNVEILGRALHALARIGDELYLEPMNEGLTFRTVQSNHSVYAEVHFTNPFFSYYKCPQRDQRGSDDDQDADALKCRINMKSYLAAFRSLPCLRKQVETCLLRIEPDWLMIKFRCHHGLIRTYRLPVIETETLQALYTVDEVPNHLIIGADVFATAVKNFQLSERDITLVVEERSAILRNYVPGGNDPAGVMRSELKLESGEFISFTVKQPTSITFCLKSFRAMLFFAEPSNLPLAVKFSLPGSPVVIVSDSSTVEVRFVLSSLAPEDCDLSQAGSQQLLTTLPSFEDGEQQVHVPKKIQNQQNKSCSLEEAWEGSGSHQPTAPSKQNPRKKTKPVLEMNTISHRPETTNHGRNGVEHQLNSTASQQSTTSATSSTRAVVGTTRGKPSHAESFASSLQSTNDNDEPNDIVIPESDHEEDGDDDDVVPASPPPVKKARIFFQRCYDPTLHPEDFDCGEIYVPDSDEDS